MISKRRREDDEDDLSLCFYLPPPRLPIDAPQEDEFGRTITPQRDGPRSALREARRSSRSTRSISERATSSSVPAKLSLSSPDDEMGYLTDSALLPSDLEDYNLARRKLTHRISTLLEDVRSEEFKDPTAGYGLMKRFSEWREKWSDSYTGAWGGLGMIGAWEFWTRLEMVEWNPFEVRTTCLQRRTPSLTSCRYL